jgi:hypothetical protein
MEAGAMNHFAKRMTRWTACAALLCVVTDAGGQPLSETERSDFIRGTVDGCLSKMDANAFTAALSSSVLAEYCGCVANGLADRVTWSDLKGRDPVVMRSIIQAATTPCAEAVRRSPRRD